MAALLRAFQAGQIVLATGEQAAAVGDTVSDTLLVFASRKMRNACQSRVSLGDEDHLCVGTCRWV